MSEQTQPPNSRGNWKLLIVINKRIVSACRSPNKTVKQIYLNVIQSTHSVCLMSHTHLNASSQSNSYAMLSFSINQKCNTNSIEERTIYVHVIVCPRITHTYRESDGTLITQLYVINMFCWQMNVRLTFSHTPHNTSNQLTIRSGKNWMNCEFISIEHSCVCVYSVLFSSFRPKKKKKRTPRSGRLDVDPITRWLVGWPAMAAYI